MALRFIGLNNGTQMGDELIIFKTNAPAEELKKLEKISCEACADGRNEDVPIWSDVLTEKGYICEYENQHQHISPYGSSKSWQEENYPGIEIYTIENQPALV